jgi:hypothetical protein
LGEEAAGIGAARLHLLGHLLVRCEVRMAGVESDFAA